jgi:hypothetical protein
MNRRYLLAVGVVVLLLLALGALPGLLRSGDPYRAHAEATTPPEDVEPVAAENLSERRYRYVTGAIADGESKRYWKGPIGLKGAFTHSPFDELDAIRTQHPTAAEGDAVYVSANGTVYRVTVHREDG